MQRECVAVAQCTVERVMRGLGLPGVVLARKCKTTLALRPPALGERDFSASRPNKLCVGILTYVATWRGFVYVAFMIDVFARLIVGWDVSGSLRTDLALDCAGASDLGPHRDGRPHPS